MFHLLSRFSKQPKKSPSRWVRPSLMSLEDRLVMDTGLAGNNFPFDNTQPYLALNYMVALNGIYPSFGEPMLESADIGGPVLGQVTLFAGNQAPDGYALANGQLLRISQYTALFSLLGTFYGGDGRVTFALPDLRGATAVGAGSGAGLSQYYLGDSTGMPTTSLSFSELPNHNHQLLDSTTNPPTVTGTTGSTGSSLPVNNLMPVQALNYQVVTNSSFNYLGEVALFGGNSLSNKAQGQLLPISANTPLFSKIGTIYGGDGVTNFALPDLQGRVAVGAGTSLTGSIYLLGQEAGTETISLTTANLAQHSHTQLNTNTQTSVTGGSQPFNNIQPYNTLTYAICTEGVYPSFYGGYYSGEEPFLGQIKLFASNTLPNGWTPCDGSSLSINQNQALYSIIGNTYGGSYPTTFALPDLRGRVPVGAGLPLTGGTYVLGQTGGNETAIMTVNTMAIHAHTAPPIVSISSSAHVAYENAGPTAVPTRHTERTATTGNQLVYTITRDNTQGAGVVRLDISGTANLQDYSLAVSTGATFTLVDADTLEITFPVNALEVRLTAFVVQDRTSETRESLIFTLVDGEDYDLHFSQQAVSGYILDPDSIITSGGLGSGASPLGTQVHLYNNSSGSLTGSVTPYPGFSGEVRVSRGDVNSDGIPEFITAPGQGGGPVVQVMNMETGQVLSSFMAYDSGFRGGIFVALEDVNGDGNKDFITSAGAGGGPHIKVFDGVTRAVVASFFAFDPSFTGGTSVAAFDVDGDGFSEIVVGAGPGGGPHVKVFGGANFALVKEFMAFDPSFRGGVFVAIGDIGLNGRADIITGAGPGGGPHVRIWDYQNLNVVRNIMAFPTSVNDQITDSVTQVGVRVGIADFNGDGFNDLVMGAGPGGGPRVQVYDGIDFELIADFFAADPSYRDGVFVS